MGPSGCSCGCFLDECPRTWSLWLEVVPFLVACFLCLHRGDAPLLLPLQDAISTIARRGKGSGQLV